MRTIHNKQTLRITISYKTELVSAAFSEYNVYEFGIINTSVDC